MWTVITIMFPFVETMKEGFLVALSCLILLLMFLFVIFLLWMGFFYFMDHVYYPDCEYQYAWMQPNPPKRRRNHRRWIELKRIRRSLSSATKFGRAFSKELRSHLFKLLFGQSRYFFFDFIHAPIRQHFSKFPLSSVFLTCCERWDLSSTVCT